MIDFSALDDLSPRPPTKPNGPAETVDTSVLAREELAKREAEAKAKYLKDEDARKRKEALLQRCFTTIQAARADAEGVQAALLKGLRDGADRDDLLMLAIRCIDGLTASGGVLTANAARYMKEKKGD